MELSTFFHQHPQVALAFSGGVDSSYLLCEALRCGAQVRAYYIQTVFQPRFEREDARRLAADLGADLTVVDYDVLSHADVVRNGPDRCYHCKRALFSLMQQRASQAGFPTIIDGTNASDPEADRPGMRALAEMGVYSPLKMCGITKDEIRRRSREAGLFTWDKPAYACLATRIPTGMAIRAADLTRVELAEDALRGLGFSDFRVRLMGAAARLELCEQQMTLALERRRDILSLLSPHFTLVTLNLSPR